MKEEDYLGNPTVLVVTINDELYRTISNEMSMLMIDVYRCTSEGEALRVLAENPNHVLAVVDMELPLLEAWHVLEILQAKYSRIPSIAVGRHLEHLLVADAYGVSTWLFQPFGTFDLKSCFLNTLLQNSDERAARAAGFGDMKVLNRGKGRGVNVPRSRPSGEGDELRGAEAQGARSRFKWKVM